MELLLSILIGTFVMVGTYLILRARTFPVIIGLSFWSYAVNLFLFSTGNLVVGKPPLIQDGLAISEYTDPLPQALVLTAIVIGFAMTAFVAVLAVRARHELKSDHVDGALGEEHDQ